MIPRKLTRLAAALQACRSQGAKGTVQTAGECAPDWFLQQSVRCASSSSSSSMNTVQVPSPVPSLTYLEEAETLPSLTPRQVVEQLDRNIVGQGEAKKAVANALRNRWRRHRIPSPLKEEIVPKNILMIGPTGCGKTEIARRLAKLADSPFVKVEATKFTEVGFHGRDVDSIIRDLVDNAILLIKENLRSKMKAQIDQAVEDKILEALCGSSVEERTKESFRQQYRQGTLDDRMISIDVPRSQPSVDFSDFHTPQQAKRIMLQISGSMRSDSERQRLTVAQARPIIEESEAEKLENSDTVGKDALSAVEQDGIVFIDEIDKIVTGAGGRYGADASSEGVQRDLLPIIEGSVVSTKHGNVKTDHILFICSGAFHTCKPSDMLAELQGRLPIRVELKGLTANDFYRILTEPEHNMIKQQQALMETEGIDLVFTDAAVREIAKVAEDANTVVDNIGARRLYTIIERIIEEISFSAPDMVGSGKGKSSRIRGSTSSRVTYTIDKADVRERIGDLLKKQDLSKFIL